DDPAVWRALVRAETEEQRGALAMRAVGKLVALNEHAADEGNVRGAVTAAAQGSAESADAAFAMMESGLGTRGPDLLYELMTTKGIAPEAVTRARQSLAKVDVKGRMSPTLSVALEWRSASGCEAKHALLPRVKENGDQRLLAPLRGMLSTKGC